MPFSDSTFAPSPGASDGSPDRSGPFSSSWAARRFLLGVLLFWTAWSVMASQIPTGHVRSLTPVGRIVVVSGAVVAVAAFILIAMSYVDLMNRRRAAESSRSAWWKDDITVRLSMVMPKTMWRAAHQAKWSPQVVVPGAYVILLVGIGFFVSRIPH